MKKRPLPALLILLPILLLPILACNPTTPNPPPPRPKTGTAAAEVAKPLPTPTGDQSFDYYLLNLSWSPEFCYSHREAPECSQHFAFVLHGLWPQNLSGQWPQNCSNDPGPADPSQFADIYPDSHLLNHEWRTHGTCSGLSPDAFFTTARTAYRSIAIPAELASHTQQISMPPAEIIGLFTKANPTIPRSSFVLSCGNNFLTAIEVCLNKTLQPTDCGPIRSCRANTVRIPPPQS